MSMMSRPADGTEVGETVASVRDYESAQATVSQLIAAEVPARDIAIVGQGVRTIERITGRLGYAVAARSGAINGVLIGLLLSAILVLGTPDAPIQLFVGFVLIGVALGMVMSLITFAIVRRRRDFASVTQLAADHYEVTVRAASLAKARKALGAQRPAPTRAPVDLATPPRYGERVAPGAHPMPAPSAGTPPRPDLPAAPPPQYGERVPEAGLHPLPSSGPSSGAQGATVAADVTSAREAVPGAPAVASEESIPEVASVDEASQDADDAPRGSGTSEK